MMEFLEIVLGLDAKPEDLAYWQMSLRAIVVFSAAILMIRIGHKRFMGGNTTLDILLGIILGSVMSRAITGNAPFFSTLAAGLTLVLFHWVLAAITFHFPRTSTLFKGCERHLVKDGELQHSILAKSHITRYDLEEAMRAHGKKPDINTIKTAYLERNGSISIILK